MKIYKKNLGYYINDLFDELQDAIVFSKIDLRSGCPSLKSRRIYWRGCFVLDTGFYEFLVMSFGLINAPATFIDLMNRVFNPYIDQFMIVSIDDILLYSKNHLKHEKHLKIVLRTLKEYNLFAKFNKCGFCLNWVIFLGHVIWNPCGPIEGWIRSELGKANERDGNSYLFGPCGILLMFCRRILPHSQTTYQIGLKLCQVSGEWWVHMWVYLIQGFLKSHLCIREWMERSLFILVQDVGNALHIKNDVGMLSIVMVICETYAKI